MLNAKTYYSKLYRRLIVQNKTLFSGCHESQLTSISPPENSFCNLMPILDDIEANYEFDLQKMCIPNYNKFYLWQQTFPGGDEGDMLAAIQFIIFCCFVDKVLDSPRFTAAEKESVCQKLQVQHFTSAEPYQSSSFPEMDWLLNQVRLHLICSKENKLSSFLEENMQCAVQSEIYMWKNPLLLRESFKKEDIHWLIDKSVAFEVAAFSLAAPIPGQKAREAGRIIASIFWLIDDLCDFVEDIQCKRKNSLLFYLVPSEEPLPLEMRIELAAQNLEKAISLLEGYLEQLQACVSRDLYQFILNTVWEWCRYVRKVAGEEHQKQAPLE